jgi:hypothetical protein
MEQAETETITTKFKQHIAEDWLKYVFCRQIWDENVQTAWRFHSATS